MDSGNARRRWKDYLAFARASLRKRLRAAADPVYDLKRSIRIKSAILWRRQFRRTAFIAITGSHSKTTTVALLAPMLAATAPTYHRGGPNKSREVARSVLRSAPWFHRYTVQEIGLSEPGSIARSVEIFRPSIGIVTAIGGDHRKAFGGSWEAIAAEKARLVEALPEDGLAVLNADDPLVDAMAAACRCRVVRFGRAETADLRILNPSSAWPRRLSFEADYRGDRFVVRSRLVGTHWTISIGAALLAGLEIGVSRETCLAAIEAAEPVFNRMSVHQGPNGAWYVLDANKASYHGIEACLGFLAEASAPRRTAVIGTLADYPGASSPHYRKIARLALKVADRVVFTGRNALRVARLSADESQGRLFIMEEPGAVLDLLTKTALPDEVIYVKASAADSLERTFVPGNYK